MARTTLDIDESVLRDLKRLQRKQGKSLGRLVSDLLAETLGRNQRDELEAARRLEARRSAFQPKTAGDAA